MYTIIIANKLYFLFCNRWFKLLPLFYAHHKLFFKNLKLKITGKLIFTAAFAIL